MTGVRSDQHNKSIASIVDYSHDAIYSKSLDGTILSWNRSAERLFGYRAEEIVGKSVSILTPEERPDEIPQILHRVARGERVEHYETIRKKKDGSPITISLTVSPIKDAQGKVIGASSIARNITREAQVADIRDFLASIVDSSDDAILSKDLDGYILSWNLGAQRLYGYKAEEVIGRHVSLLAPPEIPDDIPNIMERLNRGEKIDHYETVRITKDGRRLNISLTVSPIRDASGRLIAASAIARDITERKRQEAEKTQLMEQLQRSLAEKNILLQEVYHRVKNNLQVICSLLDLRSKYISRNPANATIAFNESIQRIRAISLVHEKLYQTSDLEKLDFAEYLRALVQQVIQAYAINKQIRLNFEGDRFQVGLNTAIPLGLILNELVTNSMKYGFSSASQGIIEIHCTDSPDSVQITYSDDGPGFDPEIDIETTDSFGFRIVRLLTKQLNGEIKVSRNHKTIFELTVPKPSGGL